MDRDALPPEPKVVRPIRWEWTDHPDHGRIVRMWSRTFGTWSPQRGWTGAIHEAIDDGEAVAGILERILADGYAGGDRDRALKRLRMYLFVLMDEGYVEMDFGDRHDRFVDRYRVERELGRGGVGVAWLCHDEVEDRAVVVKHGWDYFQPRSRADALMRNEAKTMADLAHPAILRLYDTFEADGRLHLVREFLDGDGLLETLRDRALPLGDVVAGLTDLVGHLHDRGYLLLDVRPSNFFVRHGEALPVLIDVGVCKPWQGGTLQMDRALGSPGFSAPETRSKGQASPASDVFGLGRLLFTIVAGRPPLAAWGSDELAKHLDDRRWREVLMAMCDPDPSVRPTLDEVRSAFAGAGAVTLPQE